MKKLSRGSVAALAGVVGLGLVGGGTAGAIALDKDSVTITADGEATQVSTRAKTVGQLLEQQGITLTKRDVVQPSVDTAISDGAAVTVLFARPVTLTLDGKTVTRWTTATTVEDALEQLKLDDPKNILSTNRSTAIGRKGINLAVTTIKKVTVVSWKGTKVVEVPATSNVDDALKAAGLSFGPRDKANPGLTSPISEGLKVTFTDVEEKPVTVKEELPFEKKEKEDASLPKGERKVITKGVKGERVRTYTNVFLDGKLVSKGKWVKSEKITREPVAEVIAVGTKEEKEPTKSPTTKQPVTAPAPGTEGGQPKPGGYSGSCEASMYWDPQPTASGEPFNPWAMTAAHKTLPLGTRLKVTNVANGKSVIVRINDRGPYVAGRCLDLAKGAFLQIAPESAGVAQVTYVQV